MSEAQNKVDSGEIAIPLLPYEKKRVRSGGDGERIEALIGEDGEFSTGHESGGKPDSSADDGDEPGDEEAAGRIAEGLDDEDEDGDDGEEELDGDDDGDDGEEGDEGEDLHEVTVDGETLRVPLDELKKRYGQEASFTKKSQRLAEAKKTFETEAAETRQLREEYKGRLAVVRKVLEEAAPKEPDERLLDRDPKAYMRQKALYDRHQQKMAIVEQEQEKVGQDEARDQTRLDAATLEAERESLLKAIPEWKDEKVAMKEGRELAAFLTGKGYSEKQVEGLSDHRLIVLFRNAMKFEAATKRGKKLSTARPGKTLKPGGRDTTATPGTRRSKTQAKRAAQARDRLKKSGRVDDARDAIFELLDDE